ncbi:MAG: ankyrin repeat domain-containing protein [Treponema sp.]|nr:ankyrin repeat domain-containing protein [Treponema sp.]
MSCATQEAAHEDVDTGNVPGVGIVPTLPAPPQGVLVLPGQPLQQEDTNTGATFIRAVRANDESSARNHLSRWPADVNFRDEAGRTGLMYAIESRNIIMLQTILNASPSRLNPNIADNEGRTALHMAVASHMDSMVDLLLQNSDTSTTLTDINGDTAFIIAVRNNNRAMIRAFGENPRFDVTFSPRGGLPPLLYALDRSLPPSTIRAILDYCIGAIESRDSRGNGPFEYLERSRYRSDDMEDVRDMLTEAEIRQRGFR